MKEPLSVAELRALAGKAGSVEALVAPKRRGEAEGKAGDVLLRWLAEDGGRVRRPIVEVGPALTLGFTEETRKKLDELL